MTSHVLVIADQVSACSAALQHASSLLVGTDSRISVLAFIDTSHAHHQEISHSQRVAELEAEARKHLGSRARLSLDIVATPDIAAHCGEYCRREQVTLVIKTGHRSESLGHTPLDWRLVRALPCPAIITAERDVGPDRRLLVTLDIQSRSPVQQALDRQVIAWAEEWVTRHRYALYVACCVEATDPLTNADMALLVDLESRMRPVIEPAVHRLLGELSAHCRGILIGAGSPTTVIRRLADELDATLVVAGYTERHGLAHALLGHTAEKLMHRLNRHLAVVPAGTGS